jgi:putative tryptophan/tyrosine transport system substrate-binding protein
VKRRAFIALAGAMATGLCGPARAQQRALPAVGFIGITSYDEWKQYVTALLRGLKEAGFVEGTNLTVQYRWAEGRYDRLPAMAADLADRNVDVIVTIAPPATLAAKAATRTIPIVFFMGSDPVKFGVVASLNRPGGNITGISVLANTAGSKRLQILREIAPDAVMHAMLVNPTNQNAELDAAETRTAAEQAKLPLIVVKASTAAEIDALFASFPPQRIATLLVNPDPFLLGQRERLAALALRYRIATIFHTDEPVRAGGLMSYGASFIDGHRQTGLYAGRILNCEKPADLPVLQSVKFETVINLRTAKALGVQIPPGLLALADEVIE